MVFVFADLTCQTLSFKVFPTCASAVTDVVFVSADLTCQTLFFKFFQIVPIN